MKTPVISKLSRFAHDLRAAVFNSHFTAIFLAWMVLGAANIAAADQWTTDPDSAIAEAQKQGKDLLFYFAGTEKCRDCKSLESEVFEQEDFQNEITSEFLLVRIEHRESSTATEVEKVHSLRWTREFGVTNFPTVFLVDSKLVPFAVAGYEKGGVNNYLGLLTEFHKIRVDRDEAMTKADKAKGLERAKWLDQAISGIGETIANVYYGEVIDEIISLDADNELGLRGKWNAEKEAEQRKVMMTELMLVARLEKPDVAVAEIDRVLSEMEFPVAEQLEILQMKLNIVRRQNNPEALDQLLDQMIELPGVEGVTRERLIVKKILLMRGGGRKDAAMDLLENSIEQGRATGSRNLFLWAARGEMLMADKQYEDALRAFDEAIPAARANPDLLADLVSGKAEAFYLLKRHADALSTLDNFAEDTNIPSDLRAEATLHKSMLMREMGKSRLARLSENRAVEIANTPKLRREFQNVVDRLRRKYQDAN
jgi:thioredoxin-related protein